MERSSPLAAMQHQSVPFGHGHWNLGGMQQPTSNPRQDSGMSFGSGNFNFKDISMRGMSSDYFSLKPGRGVSPTASLAVDLSQNFHIDRSPMPPTPRRSLFALNTIATRGAMLTPPPPSSSPCAELESMEISPLPHKAPYSTMINIQSPTPEPTPSVDSMLSSPCVIPESPLNSLKASSQPERRRPTLLRPTLSRTKGLTTTAVSIKSAGFDVPTRPFKFGNGLFNSSVTSASLEECFVESPVDASFGSPFGGSMAPPRPRSSYQKTTSCVPTNGSPLAAPTRKPMAPYQRPRKQYRRSLSMFEHPADVLNQQKADQRPDCGLNSIMDIDEAPKFQLPHFVPAEETIPRISKETMLDVLDGKYGQCYDRSMVIDCRFEYEYKGGHIDGAINFNNKEELASTLFNDPASGKTLLIFHCEYSAHRAPIAARFIRGEDRTANAHHYPRLTYPEIYILDGGYSSFFKDHKTRCFPQNYVEMNDKEHANACERGLGRMKQNRGKLSRAQTFAFGQHNQGLDSSPTAMSKHSNSSTNLMMCMDISVDDSSISDPRRSLTRRMASF